MNGWIGMVEIAYADISAVAFSSLVHSAAKLRFASNGRLACPLILRAPINRFSRHGPMGTEVTASWYYNVPDLDIAMPATPHEAYWLLRRAFARPVPTLFLEDRSLSATPGEIGGEGGGALLRQGRDATLIAAGRMAVLALEAAERLAREAQPLDCAVLSLGTIKPLDAAAIEAAARATGRVMAIQEEPPFGGYGPAIQSLLCALPPGALAKPPQLFARADTFLPYDREEDALPDIAAIMAKARELCA
jgi:pyruvate dehydrogenase E1 component beta subunit